MYELGSDLGGSEVEPGTNVLVSGPPLTGKRRVAMDILAHGADSSEGSIIVTTRDSADRVLADYRSRLTRPEEADIGVVDCVTKHHGRPTSDTEPVAYAASPDDLTGIGIEFSQLVSELCTERGVRRNRVMLDSLSTLLLYSDLQTVFRFVHVCTSRIDDVDALGVFVVDSTAHDVETTTTLQQLFDGVIDVDDDGSVSVQFSGPGVTS